MRRASLLALLPLLSSACTSYTGQARGFAPAALDRQPGWLAAGEVKLVRQQGERDCGPAALAMMLAYWNVPARRAELVAALPVGPSGGVRAGRLRDLARQRGLIAHLVPGGIRDLHHELGEGRPVLVGLIKPYGRRAFAHYEVVVAAHPARGLIVTLDPGAGWRQYTVAGFLAEWKPAGRPTLVVLGPRAR